MPTGEVFGGFAVELSGIVVRPDAQGHGVGPKMLKAYMRSAEQDHITAYTRNPALLSILAKSCGYYSVYPLNIPRSEEELLMAATSVFPPYPHERMAALLPHATIGEDGVAYHVNRYGGEGLYGELSDDPADRPFGDSMATLKEVYPRLKDKGTALIAVAKYSKALDLAREVA